MSESFNEDMALAMSLQDDFDREHRKESQNGKSKGNKPMALVDQQWELLDPNPDIRIMFLQFSDEYFDGKLAGIEVKWSPRMTQCAGVCVYEGRGGLCSVRLSKPLLSLRPRKDLVETLLHEMIHAFLFVTQNNRDRDGHGPEFQKHMNRLNKSTGTNITIYHSFHDEVEHFRKHWWRCDGQCRERKPYFGYVKRASNRAPSSTDRWWANHVASCGGKFEKVKEPEGYGAKKSDKKTTKIPPGGDIIKAVKPTKAVPMNNIMDKFLRNGNSTAVKNGKVGSEVAVSGGNMNSLIDSWEPDIIPVHDDFDGSSQTQITTFSDMVENEHNAEVKDEAVSMDTVWSFPGMGQTLGSGSSGLSFLARIRTLMTPPKKQGSDVVSGRKRKREHNNSDSPILPNLSVIPKRHDVESTETTSCPVCFESVNISKVNDHLDMCLSA